jgi:hypothetical protein
VIDTALLVVQVASLMALVVYVAKTWEIASATRDAARASASALAEMREARDQEVAPYVIAYFDVSDARYTICFVVENIGRSMAHNVRVVVEPPLQSTQIQDIDKVAFIQDGIPTLAPGQALRTIVDTTFMYLNHPDLPKAYHVTITYMGGLSSAVRRTVQNADLNMYQNMRPSPEPGMHHLVQEAEKLRKAIERLKPTVVVQTGSRRIRRVARRRHR